MMDSKFASPEREPQNKVHADFSILKASSIIQELINAMPNIAMILNTSRQVVFSNSIIIDMLSLPDIDAVLGKRFGEIIHCKNAFTEEGGCGTSEACMYCGAVNTIQNALNSKKKETNDCRIISKVEGKDVAHDYAVSASSIHWEGKEYIFLSLINISDEKRRRILEKVFFHDIINTAGSLKGLLTHLENISDAEQLNTYISIASSASKDLLDEIMMHRELLAAENNELPISHDVIFSKDFLQNILNQMKHHKIAVKKHLVVDDNAVCISLISDFKLLKRVVINMVKNALEAIPEESKVVLGSFSNEKQITIWVHNSTYMERDIQLRLFQRNFSTKGSDRGLGTYSMKLLGEKYLNGKVSFTSDVESGTKFFLELPLT